MTERTMIIGTRGSALALRQTQMMAAALHHHHPELTLAIHEIRTTGDREQAMSLQTIGGQGIFVKELEEALLRGTIDLAVHSLKDVPGTLPDGLALAAIPKRADARDALIARSRLSLANLPPGAVIGTGAARRSAQLRALRPDCTIADLRGNVDTRLRKALDPAGPYDAIVLALAGLKRLRRAGIVTEVLPFDTMLPAPGQGALGLETRTDDAWVREMVAVLDDPATNTAVTAERAFLAALGGGCTAPIAAWGRMHRGHLWLTGMVGRDDGTLARHSTFGAAHAATRHGQALAEEFARQDGIQLQQLATNHS